MLLSDDKVVTDPAHLYIHNKAYSHSKSDFGSRLVPSDGFLSFCEECEGVFRQEFCEEKMTRDNVCAQISQAMKVHTMYPRMALCRESMTMKIVNTFINMRVQYALKFRNRSRCATGSQRRKLKKVTHM